MTVTLLEGDCRDVLRTLADGSVHCCVTSPPYWGLRSYLPTGHANKHLEIGSEATVDEWVETLVGVFREVRRVLRADGVCFINLGDSYATGTTSERKPTATGKHGYWTNPAVNKRIDGRSVGLKPKDLIGQPWRLAFALQADGWYLRQDIIWSKPNPMPESVRDRCTKAHEYLFLLAKSERYYYDAEAIAEPAGWPLGPGNVGPDRAVPGQDTGENGNVRGRLHKIGPRDTRNKRSVWTVSTQPFDEAHFATFPPALIEPCIKAGCPAGGTVLDPFGGAGTTGLVADRLQRDAILIELNPAYAEIARRRIVGDSPLFAEMA